TRENCPRGPVLRREEAVSERRLLLGYRAGGSGHPDIHVHVHLCTRTHGWRDYPVGRDDYRSRIQDRSSASVVCWCGTSRRPVARRPFITDDEEGGGAIPSIALRDDRRERSSRFCMAISGRIGSPDSFLSASSQ